MKFLSDKESFSSYLIENFDDLWVLNKYILKGDLIKSKTQRKVAIGSNKTKQVTKTILVILKVSKITLHVDHIKIQGEIQNETEFTTLGSHHSLSYFISNSIEINDSLNFNNKTSYVKNLLKTSLATSKNKALIIICDVDSIIISRCSLYSIEIILEKYRLGNKKYFSTSSEKSGVEEMYELLKEIQFFEYNIVVFSGPGTYKIKLKELCLKFEPSLKTYSLNVTSVEKNAISNILEDLKEKKIFEQAQEDRVEEKVNEFLYLLNSNPQKVAYGEIEVFKAIEQCQCSTVIILSTAFDSIQEEKSDLLLLLEQTGGQIVIASSQTQSGSIVQGMGNIIALLRF